MHASPSSPSITPDLGTEHAPPASARWIWAQDDAGDRNPYVMFRKRFEVRQPVLRMRFSLFADTRYRLIVNGVTVGHGPCRFFKSAPEYDTWEIAPLLKTGDNVIAIMVNAIRTMCFQAELATGGLKAWGQGVTVDGPVKLTTDDSWRAIVSPMHDPDTGRMSFALNPAEVVDLRAEPAGWADVGYEDEAWPAAVEMDASACPWGPLRPRSIAPLDESAWPGPRLISRWRLDPVRDERVYSLHLQTMPREDLKSSECGIWLTLEAAEAGEFIIALPGCRVWHAGQPLEPENDPEVAGHHRQLFRLVCDAGPQSLFVWFGFSSDVGDFCIGLPPQLRLAADHATVTGPHAPAVFEGAEKPDGSFTPGDAAARFGAPPQELSFKQGHRSRGRASAWTRRTALPLGAPVPKDAAGVAELYDFGHEYLGRARVRFTAAPGQQVNIAYSERLNDDGSIHLHGRYLVDMIDGVTARSGEQSWHAFHPRGGRYLEVAAIGEPGRFQLHALDLTRAIYPVPTRPTPGLADPRLEAIWELGRQAFITCSEDAYLDCPWRERGVYIGDALVQLEIAAVLGADLRLARRTIELFLQGQGADNGLLRPGAHGLAPGKHPDYSAILPQCARRYHAHTGDASILTDYADHWRRLHQGLLNLRHANDTVYDGGELNPYIDIALHQNRQPRSCAMNLFMYQGLRDLAWIFEQLRKADLAAACTGEADRLKDAIVATFWSSDRGLLLDLPIDAEGHDQEPSIHSNALSVLYDVLGPEKVATVEPWLVQAAADNFFGKAGPESRAGVRCNAYFSFYLLGALAKLNRFDAAVDYIRTCWGYMLDRGAWTTCESFGGDRGGSLNHVWGGAPTWFLSTFAEQVSATVDA